MFGGLNPDSFGANWGFQEFSQADETGGGFLDEDVSNFVADEPTNRNRNEGIQKKTFMPLKISMIHTAWRSGGSFINIMGYQLEIMKVVGRIISATVADQETKFVLDDGSGRLECIFMHPGNITEWRRRALDHLCSNKPHVRIYGGFNPIYSSESPTIIIYSIKELNSFDETKLHDLDVIHAILVNNSKNNPDVADTISEMDRMLKQFDIVRNSEVPLPAPAGATETKAGQNPAPSKPQQPAPSKPQQPIMNQLTLTKYIAALLANEARNSNPNGLHISEILKRCKLQHSFQSISEQHVRKVLGDLERDATVYQTLDSNTFASTDS